MTLGVTFGATFWSMIGLTKVISPMGLGCDLSVTPKIVEMKTSSIPLRPSLVSKTGRAMSSLHLASVVIVFAGVLWKLRV